jgi:hypothetical protein
MPVRSGSYVPGASFASSIAMRPAAMANRTLRPAFSKTETSRTYRPRSNSRTCAANVVGKVEASKISIGRMPLLPASRFRHVSSTERPSGVTEPIPVMTMRRFIRSLHQADATARVSFNDSV